MKNAYLNLETLDWKINNSPDVNPVLADTFTVDKYTGGMTTVISAKPYGGALAATPPLQVYPGATRFTLNYEMRLSGNAPIRAQALEFDMMIIGPDGFVYNGSCQCAVAEGYQWQIAKPGGWQNVGFSTPLVAATLIKVQTVFACDFAKKIITAKSITVNGLTFPVTLPPQAALDLKWAPVNNFIVQRQLDVNANGGAFSVDDQNISVTQE
jgi:hypothetical protein